MAKIGFSKLGIKLTNEIINIEFNNFNIEVKQYLPVAEKLEVIAKVLGLSHDENNFSNPLKIQTYLAIEIIERYTNITFTEKQKENPAKLYDLILNSGLVSKIIEAIPQEEYDTLVNNTYETINSVYNFQNSALGILEGISQDYNALDLNATELQQKIADPNTLELLKGIMTKLG